MGKKFLVAAWFPNRLPKVLSRGAWGSGSPEDDRQPWWFQGLVAMVAIGLGLVGGWATKNLLLYHLMPPLFPQLMGSDRLADDEGQVLAEVQMLAKRAAFLAQGAVLPQEWDVVVKYWQEAIALLDTIPNDSPQHNFAQDRRASYQKNLDYAMANFLKPAYWRGGVNHAMEAALKAQVAHTPGEWETVAHHWERAIQLLGSIPAGDVHYAQAQARLPGYRQNHQYAIQQGGDPFIAPRPQP